ncbi:hypothetical protein [Saccharothrix obliqua]|uniref:hypothetical protein n=1 Tax=Saccharothrix obliqua TaxID=2861747 RepID=UPI002150E596|nr:hypothetical protein [Saccharothrix obliqua]
MADRSSPRHRTAHVADLPVAATPLRQRIHRRGLVVLLSSLGGFLLSVVWSAQFVDDVIGGTVVDALLGEGTRDSAVSGVGSGVLFALVSGLAGTFTACNIAAFGVLAPMLDGSGNRVRRALGAMRPLGWVAIGMFAVSAAYGVVVGLVGTSMPQFSTATGSGMPARLVQSMVVFGIIGLAMTYLGLAALGLVRDPFARLPNARLVFFGALIGGFLIGRPFPLFRALFRDAAESGNPLYGAAAFCLQSLGNIALMAVIFLVMAYAAGGRAGRWLAASPNRVAVITAAALLVAGVFTLLYWDVRLLARRDIIPWYPTAPWA